MEPPPGSSFEIAFTGVRSFVPWRRQTILKWSFPTLRLTDRSIDIQSGMNHWNVPWPEVSAILYDPKAILVRRSDGTSGRFKATKKTIREVCRRLDELQIPLTQAEESTYWMVNADPRWPPTGGH